MVSKYSKYYGTDKYDPTRLVCLTCNVSMKKAPRNATSGLRRHLATHHKEQYIELTKIDELKAVVMTEEAQKNLQLCKDVMMEEAQRTLAMCQESVGEQLNLDSICSQWSATESEEPCQLNKAVLRCIVEEGLPVSFLDSAAAQDLLSLATNGQYNLPSSSHFTALEIPEAYEKLKRVILNAIKECPSVSLTVRGLPKKDRSSPSLLGVSAHWLTDDFERKNAFIGTFSVAAYVEGSVDFVERSLNDFDIPRVKVRCLTRTVEDVIHPEFSAHNVPCFDQMLHQCAGMLQCNIDNWRFTFFHLQDICKFLQESKLAKEDYIICLQLADLCNFPSKGSSDSWESTYQLCERFLDAKSVVEHLLVKYANLPKLTDKDWKNIEMAKKLMKPFCDASKVTHYSDSAPISVIIPFVRVLLMGFEVNKKDSPDSQRLFNQMTSAVSPYLKMEELQIAAVLDPRFKLNFLLDEDTAPVKEKILKHAAALACKGKQNTTLGLGLHQVKSEPDPHFGWEAPGTRNVYGYGDIPEPSTIASSEVEPYLSEKWNMNKGPLVYWQQNKHRFPILTQLMSSSQPPATAPAAQPQLTQQQIVQLAGQGIHFIRILRTTVLQINEMVNNAPSMKDVDQNILRKMFVRMNDIYGKLEDIAHQLPERTDTTPQLDALAALYNQERSDNNIFGAKLPLAITQQKTQVDGYLKSVRQADSSSQYWYFAEQLYKLGGTVPGNSVMYAQRRRLFLDPPALTFTEYTPENNPHSSFINAFFHLKEEAHKKKYGIWLEILENSGQGSVLEIKTGVLVDKQPVITQKTLVVENNGNVDMVVFVAPHEEWKFLDEAGEYGRKVDIMQRSKFSVYQKLTAVANMSLTTLLSHGHDRTPAQIMQNVFHLLSRYHKVFETKCKICGKVMKNYLPCVYFDPRQPAQSLHEGCR